jgi:hypothetical protein
MDSKAAELVGAIEHATRHMRTGAGGFEAPPLDLSKPWDPHCSHMFRETMRQLAGQGVRVDLKLFADEGADANKLSKRIRQDRQDWTEVDFRDVQSLANRGVLVIGTYINASGPGHLAIVYPIADESKGPLVRDGNIHRNKQGVVFAASSYGAVPANQSFGPLLTQAKWYTYRH